jgi:hypothetical protein
MINDEDIAFPKIFSHCWFKFFILHDGIIVT